MPQFSVRLQRRRFLFPVQVLTPTSEQHIDTYEGIALLDTGATVSGIGPRVIARLGLESHAKNRLGSATEERFVDYYLFRIAFPLEDSASGAPQWPYIFEETDGFSWARETDFDVIVGMDVLQRCDIDLRRGGHCTVCFG